MRRPKWIGKDDQTLLGLVRQHAVLFKYYAAISCLIIVTAAYLVAKLVRALSKTWSYLEDRATILPIATMLEEGYSIILGAILVYVAFGALRKIRRVQRNIVGLDCLVMPRQRVNLDYVSRYAEFAFQKFNPGSSVHKESRDPNEMRDRFLTWFSADETAITVFSLKRAQSYDNEIVGGYWLIGLPKNIFDMQVHEDVEIRKKYQDVRILKDLTVPVSSLDCYAIQITGVTGADTKRQILGGFFIRSEVVLSHLYENVRRQCVLNPHVKKIGNTNYLSDVTYVQKMFGMTDEYSTPKRCFWTGNAENFRNDNYGNAPPDRYSFSLKSLMAPLLNFFEPPSQP